MKLYALKVSEILEYMTSKQRQDALSLLCVSRKKKIERLRNETLKDKSMLTGLLIGYGVHEWLGVRDKEADHKPYMQEINKIKAIEELLQKNQEYEVQYGRLEFAYGEAEKPYIPKQPDIHFNVSHAGEYILLAVSSEEIGIDVEKIKKVYMDVAARCFHAKEYEALQALRENPALQKELFYTYWTAKESYIKCIGRGLGKEFSSFWIDLEEWIVWDEEETEHRTSFCIKMLEIDDCYKAAVCMEE